MTITGRRWRRAGLALALATLALNARPAAAQGEPVIEGVLAVGTGIEGADPGIGSHYWHRARTRLQLGAEWGGTESPFMFGAYGLFELERSGAFGLEARARGTLPWGLGAFAGPIFIWRPRTLLGAHGGVSYIHRFTSEIALGADLGLASFPFGNDRPQSDAIVTWLTFDLALRVAF